MLPLPNKIKYYAVGARYLAHKALFAAKNASGAAKISPPSLKEKPPKIKKVLLCMNRHDYGKKEWGDSLEYLILYPPIKKLVQAEFFDYREFEKTHGRAKLNGHLLSIAKKGEFDLMLFSLMVDDFDKKTITQISASTPTTAANWFSDDQWRFESFSSKWADAFNFVTTTDRSAVQKYSSLGYPYALRTQWAAYPPRFTPDSKFGSDMDISFVGQKYGNRPALLKAIGKKGIKVSAFGPGWKGGRLEYQQMVNVLANSKITICPSESSVLFAPPQMKARFFEVPACGGFQLAGFVDELSDYFTPDKEIIMYKNTKELVENAEYFLENEGERKKIAKAAHERTMREHTYERRFEAIFSQMEKIIQSEKK